MSSVDDRIVNMQFNNKQFLTGATESQKALEGLDKTLANTGNSKGLTTMGSAVDQVAGRFSALQVAGVTALATIVSKATSAGLNMVKSLTISPIMDGFREYELNLKSVQTIMANTGEPIKKVNTYLNELNHYSDQTIYNFSQMSDAIGKFTAAGVKLPAATDAIKGMANTAALTGASSMQLNSAMYQMSQALASGTIKLMDWNSLVNANMGTQNMQKALMATNRTLDDNGALMDESIKQYGTFRDSLTSGWLTAETFTKTMKVMAGQTTDTGETVAFTVEQLQKMGYAKDAAKELHRLSAASIESATKIKSFTQLLDVVKESVGSGFAQVFQNLFGNLKEAGTLWTTVGTKITDAVGGMFTSVNSVLAGWKKLGGYTATWNAFGNIFQTIGNLLHPFVAAFQAILPASGQAGKGLADASKGFETATEWIEKASRGAEVLTPILVAVAKGIKFAFSSIGDVVGLIKPVIGSLDQLRDLFKNFKMTDINLSNILSFSGDVAGGAADMAKDIVAGIAEGLKNVSFGDIQSAVSGVATSIIDAFKSALGIHSPATEMIPIGVNVVLGIFEGIQTAVTWLFNGIAALGAGITDAFQQLFGGMDSLDIAALMNAIFTGGFLLAARSMMKSFGSIADGVNGLLTSVGDSLNNFTEALGTQAKTELIKSYAIAIGVLAASLLILSFVPQDKLIKSLSAMGVMLTLLVGSLFALGKVQSQMNIGLIAASLLLISAAMINLATAVVILGSQDFNSLAKGLGAMAVMLALLVGSLFALSKIKGSIEGMAGSILVIAIALNMLAGAIALLGSMNLKTLGKGLGAIAIGLGLMVGAMLTMDKMKGSVEGLAGSILIMSAALILMATAVGMLGNMDMGTLAKGFAAMAIGLGIMVAAVMVMSGNSAGVLAAAGAMVLMATALNMLVGVILILGAAPWDVVAKGLLFVAAALGVFLLAGLGAMYVAPGLLALGVSLALIGAALFLAGAGMLAFGTGFALLAAAGVAGVAILVAAFNAFIAMLPSIAIQMAAAFVAFLEAIAKAAPRIRDAMSKIFAEMLGVVKDAIPEIVDLVIELMDNIFKAIKNYVKRLGELFSLIIKTILNVLRKAIPDVVDAGTDIALKLLEGIRAKLPKFLEVGGDIIVEFIKGIGKQAIKITEAAAETILDFIKGLTKAIEKYDDQFRDAGLEMALAIANGMSGGLLGRGFEIVKSAAESLANALPGWMKKVLGINSPAKETIPIGEFAAEGVAVGLVNSMKKVAGAATEVGTTVGKSIATGINNSVIQAIAATTALVNAVVVTGQDAINQLHNQELQQIGAADFEQRIADFERQKSDAQNRVAERARAQADRKDKEAERAKAQAERLEERAKKAKKESEAEYKRLMALAKEQQKHADKLRAAAKEQNAAAKAQEKAANQAQKAADKAQKAADKQREAAEKLSQQRQDAEAWASMSAFDRVKSAYGDQLKAQGAYDSASMRLAQLQSQRAKLLENGVTKKERAEIKKLNGAIKDTKSAIGQLGNALDAAKARAAALFQAFIEEERGLLQNRIKGLQEERAAYEANVKWQEAYDAANNETRAAMLEARAKDAEARATQANKDADAAIQDANDLMERAAQLGPANADLAKSLIEQANGMVDRAEAMAQAAQDAADRARDDRKQAKDLLEQAKQENATPSDTPSSGGSVITPSRSVLEDAANVIDRYAASLAQAEEAMAASQTIVQFTQTNNSPEALSASEIYRKTKNILSIAELKMGAP